MTWQEIIDEARSNYSRNSPLMQQRLVELLQHEYQILLDRQEWEKTKEPITIELTSTAVDGEQFLLPKNFDRVDEDTDFIVDNDTYNYVIILTPDEVAFYRDDENRDNQVAYFGFERRKDTNGAYQNYLVFYYGERPNKSISFTGIMTAEEIIDGENTDEEPKYLPKKFHDILIYGLAKRMLVARNIDQTEQITLIELRRMYNERLEQYERQNNEIALGA